MHAKNEIDSAHPKTFTDCCKLGLWILTQLHFLVHRTGHLRLCAEPFSPKLRQAHCDTQRWSSILSAAAEARYRTSSTFHTGSKQFYVGLIKCPKVRFNQDRIAQNVSAIQEPTVRETPLRNQGMSLVLSSIPRLGCPQRTGSAVCPSVGGPVDSSFRPRKAPRSIHGRAPPACCAATPPAARLHSREPSTSPCSAPLSLGWAPHLLRDAAMLPASTCCVLRQDVRGGVILLPTRSSESSSFRRP